MDNSIRHLSKEIRGGRLLEENIPKLFSLLAEHYDTYAAIRLAMHYYAFYETYCDDEDLWSKDAIELTDRLNLIVRDHILKHTYGTELEEAVRTVDAVRRDIMQRMEVLTCYTDIFQIYEYVLNRLEYRFQNEVPEPDDEEFAREILRYIFDTEDNIIINEKIKEIIGQLPVRMARQKYFDLVKDSLGAYLGADRSSLETYIYMFRTSAMLQGKDDVKSFYPGLQDKKEQLSNIEFRQITKETFDKAQQLLQAATLTLETEITVILGLQELANEVYTRLLCGPYAGMVTTEFDDAKEAATAIITAVSGYFHNNKKEEPSEAAAEKLKDMEGVQEELYYLLSPMEDALYEVDLKYQSLTGSLMLTQVLKVLLRSQSLLSDSMFIDLEEEQKQDETVDEEMIEKEAKAIKEELAALFDTSDRMVIRAVIANTINKMPVFFSSHKEVMDYVLSCLSHCTDIYEKAACFEIINEIMSD